MREHRKLLDVSTGGRWSVCGRTVKHISTPVGAGGFIGWGGEGLVVLEEGEKVVVAVGGKVGGVKVRQ